jgi:hypothetical protein
MLGHLLAVDFDNGDPLEQPPVETGIGLDIDLDELESKPLALQAQQPLTGFFAEMAALTPVEPDPRWAHRGIGSRSR